MIDIIATSSPPEMRRSPMDEITDITTVEHLKKELITILIQNDFNLLHPHVLHLSCKIDTLLIPFFRNQLPKAKVIQFPSK